VEVCGCGTSQHRVAEGGVGGSVTSTYWGRAGGGGSVADGGGVSRERRSFSVNLYNTTRYSFNTSVKVNVVVYSS